jgi:hypothetical protein
MEQPEMRYSKADFIETVRVFYFIEVSTKNTSFDLLLSYFPAIY